jgi:hypothetical protein
MAIRSQIPKLKKNESAASFKARVKTWELRTGKKYPKPGIGPLSNEQRILGGALTIGSLNKKDYSKGKEGEKWRDEVSDLALKELRIQKSADETEALQRKINADRKAGKLSNIPAPEEEPKSKILYGEDLMDVYGPYGAKYDKEDDGEFERPNTTKLQVARSLSTGGDPIPPDPGGKGGVSESKASGGVKWGTDKKYPLMIGGKKTSQIQRKLIDAGHDPIKLAELMKKHKEKYGNRRFLGIGGR